MGYEQLQELARSYPVQDGNALSRLAGGYRVRRERGVLDLAAMAVEVGVDDIWSLGLEPESHPQVLEAFRHAYPTQSVDALRRASEGQLQRWAKGIKGTLFEILVRDGLNAGESIGDIKLPPGAEAMLAEDLRQPGWDLKIVDKAGRVLDRLQLKATGGLGYVKDALEKYPDIRIIVPGDIDAAAALDDRLVAAGITNAHLDEVVDGQLHRLREGALARLLRPSAKFVFDALPVASMVVIGLSEGRQVLMGRSTVEQALARGMVRLGRSAAYSVIGAGLAAARRRSDLATDGHRVADRRGQGPASDGDGAGHGGEDERTPAPSAGVGRNPSAAAALMPTFGANQSREAQSHALTP